MDPGIRDLLARYHPDIVERDEVREILERSERAQIERIIAVVDAGTGDETFTEFQKRLRAIFALESPKAAASGAKIRALRPSQRNAKNHKEIPSERAHSQVPSSSSSVVAISEEVPKKGSLEDYKDPSSWVPVPSVKRGQTLPMKNVQSAEAVILNPGQKPLVISLLDLPSLDEMWMRHWILLNNLNKD